MSKVNGFLVVVIFIQLFIITLLCCYARQRDVNEKIVFSKLEKEIILLKEKNDTQDDLISAIIRTEAMRGDFDKKE